MQQGHVSVIVLNWNGWRDTLPCLDSLIALDWRELSIVVVDNASSDDSVERIIDWAKSRSQHVREEGDPADHRRFTFLDFHSRPPEESQRHLVGTITLLQSGGNLGYAGGNNVGLRFAMSDPETTAFWVLNNDVVVDNQAISAAMRRTQTSPVADFVGSLICYYDNRDLIQCAGGGSFSRLKGRAQLIGIGNSRENKPSPAAVEAEMDFVNGAALLVTRKAVDLIGLMQDDYFLNWEEVDWAWRARGLLRLGYAEDSIVYHKVGASIGTRDVGERSPLSEYYLTRNRLLFCRRFSKRSMPWVVADILRHAGKWALARRFDRALLLMQAALDIKAPKPR